MYMYMYICHKQKIINADIKEFPEIAQIGTNFGDLRQNWQNLKQEKKIEFSAKYRILNLISKCYENIMDFSKFSTNVSR